MAVYFEVELDTTAPVVTWDGDEVIRPGDTVVVNYVLDEPELLSAVLRLPDDREVVMTVGASTLTAQVPSDAPSGDAIIEALVRDDVLNEDVATFTLSLLAAAAEFFARGRITGYWR